MTFWVDPLPTENHHHERSTRELDVKFSPLPQHCQTQRTMANSSANGSVRMERQEAPSAAGTLSSRTTIHPDVVHVLTACNQQSLSKQPI